MVDQVEEIKDKVDIVQLISEYLPLKRAGRNWKALCPFHSEKTPSFMVNPERGIFKCFGCGKGGDAFTFLQEMEGIEFPEALRILAKRTGVKLARRLPDERYQERERLYEINALASRFYAYLLEKHEVGAPARAYLKKRKITKAAIETFKLGYAPRSWENLRRFLVKKGYRDEEVEKAGLIIRSKKKRGWYDRFRGRVMFPLTDHRGNIRGFAGRLLDPEAKEAKYVNTPETPIYVKGNLLYGLDVAKESIRRSRQAVVVEGETDMIASYAAGVKNVVAIKGSALTEGQIRLLKRYAEEILLALDADLAGDEAARRGIELAERAGLAVKMVDIPVGKDPDECVRKDPKAWTKAVKEAVSVYDFVIDRAVKRHGGDNAEAKQQIAQDVLPFIAGISAPILQAHYRQKVAGILEMSEEVVVEAMKKISGDKKPIRGPKVRLKASSIRKSRQEMLEEYLLSLLLQGLRKKEDRPRLSVKLSSPVLKRLWEELTRYFKKNKRFVFSKFVASLPPELVDAADRLGLKDLGALTDDPSRWRREIDKVLSELEQFSFRKEVRELSERLDKVGEKR
jgi:DNA primase